MKTILTITLLFTCVLGFGQQQVFKSPSRGDTIYYDHPPQMFKGGVEYVGSGIPFASDLLLNYSSRVGNYLIDEISGDTAIILTPEYTFVNSNVYGLKTNSVERIFDGNNYTLYFRASLNKPMISTTASLINFGGGTPASRGASISASSGNLRLYISDGITNSATTIVTLTNINNVLGAIDFFDVIINIDAVTSKTCNMFIYNTKGGLLYSISKDISGYTFANEDNSGAWNVSSQYFILSNLKKFSGLKTLQQCIDNSYSVGLSFWMPNISNYTNIFDDYWQHGSNYTSALNYKYVNHLNNFYLDYGYTKEGSFDTRIFNYHIPNDINKTEILKAEPNYYKIKNDTGGVFHNMVDSKIRFKNSFFDRSDTLIWNQLCRNSSWYDTINRKDFHLSELNYRTLHSYLNDGYAGRLYIYGSSEDYNGSYTSSIEDTLSIGGYFVKKLNSIFLYSSDKKGTDNKRVLDYTGDSKYAVLSGVSTTYDTNNYVNIGTLKSTKPMMSIRIDDGLSTAYSGWRELFDSLGVKGSCAVLTGMMGTPSYMSWVQVKELYDDGWEIMSHGELATVDLGDSTDNYIDSILIKTKNDIESNNISVNNFCPHLYGQTSLSLRSLAMQYYRSTHAGFTIAASEEANPQEIILDNFQALRGDISGDFLLDQPSGITAIKAEIDKCLAGNRWVVLYIHGYTAAKAVGLREVLEYAQSLDVDIVTINEALNNCKYLK